jgi:putative iron-regulated protein
MKIFKKIATLSILTTALLGFTSCNKSEEATGPFDTNLNAAILTDFATNIAVAKYSDLKDKVSILNDQVTALEASKTEANLNACRQTWRDARRAWEQSEAHLFGPVSTDNIDPRIDTWPVNFIDLDLQLASPNAFTEAYIDNLEDALKGFHPIEYLLFGENGDKAATSFTTREFEYLKGLTTNVKKLTAELSNSWEPTSTISYYNEVVKAGNGSTAYITQLAAFEEVINAMAGICDEVANGKITEPFLQNDPNLEESPFAKSSIPDFTNNITGSQNVYLGKYTTDGKGLEDMVRKYNLQLDSDIKLKFGNAIAALKKVTDPFGAAITTQPIQVQNAIDAINELKVVLEDDLLKFVRGHAK